MIAQFQFLAQLSGFSDLINLHVGQKVGERFAVLKNAEFEVRDINQAMPEEPALRMSRDSAQQLMDELFRIGIRPSDGSGSAGQMAATERHLEDMRRLVFENPAPTVVEQRPSMFRLEDIERVVRMAEG